jgi:hypothetical protein
VLVRTAARLLAHGAETRSATRVRQLSADLADRDGDFLTLRNKIHVRPEPADADAVRAYAQGVGDAVLADDYAALAESIDTLFSGRPPQDTLSELARRARARGELAEVAVEAARTIAAARMPGERFSALAEALAGLRDALTTTGNAQLRLAALDASLALETDLFAAATALDGDTLASADRATRRRWLAAAAEAVYGAGLASPRQRRALGAHALALTPARVSLAAYKGGLDGLALAPGWGTQRLRFHFAEPMQTLTAIEPKAARFIEDQLRGSPLFVYARLLDSLLRDANRLAGVRLELFGEAVGGGLRALNPGLARGRLMAAPGPGMAHREDGIYVLPETTADLPPVAGILTAGEGNPLSHVQLLARNLGIPNVGVDEQLLPALTPHFGDDVVLAVSPAGSVQLARDTSGNTAPAREPPPEAPTLIRPDLEKLDLTEARLLSLSQLRAADSGRTVGPKAAKLGELKHQFPEAVEEGLAIPFGVFRSLLDTAHPDGGSLFAWMQAGYRRLEAMPAGSAQRREATEAFRAALYERVLRLDPGDAFRDRLRARMTEVFGADASYGVFVRSDTNVEDLPGFTGAGLNLTVANVVGYDAVLDAISRVWASPFTARAFAWRQAHMSAPEHVYPAILLMKSVPADKSGVMVTRDVDTGDAGWLSVAVNEGVGGAVDGQAAESLRIEVATGRVRLMAQATAPWRRRLRADGGVERVPASGSDSVLEEREIAQLIDLSRVLPQRFPAIVDGRGQAAAADVEFGFLAGDLKLFQIRPLVESRRARSNVYLLSLDANLRDLQGSEVDMSEVPPR